MTAPSLDREAIRTHVEILHQLATPLNGKLIVASFGEDLTKGRQIVPKVCQFRIGETKPMVDAIFRLGSEPFRNVYVPTVVMRSDLPDGDKGGEADVIASLGLVGDFDDDDASHWLDRLPAPANYVLQTSAERYQTFYFANRPTSPDEAKRVALKLKQFTRCDHGSGDVSHVWRVPGTLNWPNAKKVKGGRPTEPQLVQVLQPWDGVLTSLTDLDARLPDEPAPRPKPNGHDPGSALSGEGQSQPDLDQLLAKLPSWVIQQLKDASGDRSKAIHSVVAKLCEFDFDDTTIERIIRHFSDGIGSKYVGRRDLAVEISRIRTKTAPNRRARAKNGKYDPEVDQTAVDAEIARSQDTLEQLIGQFNSDYAVVNDAGKVWVCKWRTDPVLDRDVLDYIRHAEFKKLYENKSLSVIGGAGKAVTKTLAAWWLEHPRRRQYLAGVCFDPTGRAPPGYLNLWHGFAAKPKPGDWGLMRAHIDLLCGGKPEPIDYVLSWLARLVQYPNLPAEVALVLRGEKGSGKGMFGRWVVAMFGRHGLQILNAAHLVGRFNEHLRDLVVLFGDEAFYAGDRQHEGVLKGLVTEPFLPIEGKGKPLITAKNMLHLILASNSDWVIPASTLERRYCVIDVPDTRCGAFGYFSAIEKQMQSGGLAAMLHDLLRRDISGFEVRDVPQTDALASQKLLSLSSLERWWLAVLGREFVWRSRHGAPYFREWQEFYATELLDRSYRQWCDENHPFDRKNREQLGHFMARIYSPVRPRNEFPVYELDSINADLKGYDTSALNRRLDEVSIVRKDRPTGYRVGTIDEARDKFLKHYDVPAEWRSIPPEAVE